MSLPFPEADTVSAKALRSAIRGRSPSLDFEHRLWDSGLRFVVGIDEVGRGSWAGPLTIAALIVPRDHRLYKVRDSKMLTEAEREVMHDRIVEWADRISVGHASPAECDTLGMSAAQRLAARRALDGLAAPVDHVLVDGNWNFVEGVDTTMIIKGDTISLSIAAASIIAKVTRDRLMRKFDLRHPGYSFASNKGYPCPRHKAALVAMGPSAIHRRSWSFMDDLRWTGTPRVAVPGFGAVGGSTETQLGLF